MNTVVQSFLEQVDPNGWYIVLLIEIIYLRSDPNVAVPKGESS